MLRVIMRMVAAVFALAAAAAAAQQQPRPIFRSGIDLVTVDAVVLDRNGRPIRDLTADDFAVTAAGKPRRVVSAEFFPIATVAAASPEGADAGSMASSTSNVALRESRSFLIVVDIERIASGGGMAAMHAFGDFVAGLAPDDRVGLVALPYGRPRVDLTLDRARMRQALGQIAGAGQRRDDAMSVGEAVSIDRGDRKVLEDWAERTRCGDPAGARSGTGLGETVLTPECGRKARDLAGMVVRDERRRSQNLFDSLRSLARAMAPIRGLKTIVLVSEGMLRDWDVTEDLRRFAEAAAAARVTLYSLVLDAPQTEAADSMMRPPDRRLDAEIRTGGMAEAASAAGGEMFLVSGTADRALRQIDTQLAGYYLLSFASEPGDDSDRRRSIRVAVRRADATVRARTDFSIHTTHTTPALPTAAPNDARAGLAELIRWPVPVADIPVYLATFAAAPVAGDPVRQVVVVAELPAGAHPVAAGFEIVDGAGKTVADLFDPAPKVSSSASGLMYLTAASLAPGRYRLKFGVLAAEGRRGSVEHGFQVETPAAAPPRTGDLLIGIPHDAALRPIARVPPQAAKIAVQLELRGAQPGDLDRTSVELEILRPGDEAPLASAPMPVESSADPLRRIAAATVTIRGVPAGEYVVRATVRGGAAPARVSRLVRID
jgi:VWFA-related protein